ncbi:MAG: hypothetical protein H6Q19_1491 [Bacteroidetes bacterium]|nr:hypothetical protein [Bacteroidota bacterium]
MKMLKLNHTDTSVDRKLTIMIFLEGAILGPKRLIDHFSHAKYIPIGNCIAKINRWSNEGARIVYMTYVKKESSAEAARNILVRYGFSGQYLYHRIKGEKYKDIVEAVKPDILIEDDCKSIGGKWQMSITYVDKDIKNKIKSIVVKEFKGIDLLPDNLTELMNYEKN